MASAESSAIAEAVPCRFWTADGASLRAWSRNYWKRERRSWKLIPSPEKQNAIAKGGVSLKFLWLRSFKGRHGNGASTVPGPSAILAAGVEGTLAQAFGPMLFIIDTWFRSDTTLDSLNTWRIGNQLPRRRVSR